MADSAEPPEADADLPSCDGCRKRKLRCSREWPTCSHCSRLASKCTYEYQRKKPGLKGGVVDALTRRVDALESAVFNSSEDDNGVSALPVPSVARSPNAAPTPGASSNLGGILSTLAQEIRDLNSSISSLPARTVGEPTVSPSSTQGSYQEDGTRLQSQFRRKRTRLNSFSNLDETYFPNIGYQNLLSHPEFIEELLDAYFENTHPWIPILHETRFRSRLADRKYYDRYLIILNAMVVCSIHLIGENSRFTSNINIQEVITKSKSYITFNAMADLTVENLQALVIITFADISQGDTTKAWSTIGSLARTVQYLHLSFENTDLVQPAALLSNLPTLHPPDDWIEEEERRRLFWNVFVLDRFCSVTTGWNVSLTADDICRRLPIDGGLWKRNRPALTPYLGIWDHSAAKIGHTITFLPSKYDRPEKYSPSDTTDSNDARHSSNVDQTNATGSTSMSSIGAFAYYIESLESLSRINTYFVQQKIDFTNRQEVFNWLTRFKELDLRLVHWKMFLPQRWKSPNNNPAGQIPTTLTSMDPNMTLAHITHNMSSILLHQRIAYPTPDIAHLNLPNGCSADTCFIAATETANITTKYLNYAPTKLVFAPHFAICVFVSAKVLLIHSLHYKMELAPEFWTLVESLEAMNLRWAGALNQAETDRTSLARILALQLRRLYSLCKKDAGNYSMALFAQVTQPNRIDMRTPNASSHWMGTGIQGSASHHTNTQFRSREMRSDGDVADVGAISEILTANPRSASLQTPGSIPYEVPSPSFQYQTEQQQTTDDLSIISQGFMDQDFLEMNRIINYDDFLFNTDPTNFPGASAL